MADKNNDKGLVKLARHGDRAAFDALMLRYQSRVTKLIIRYIRDPIEALDVTQEVFIKALRALPSFRGDSTFYTWLYRIAINTAKNYILAEGRRPVQTNVDITELERKNYLNDNNTPERLLIGEELMTIIFNAINSLPHDLKQVILLREIEGLSYETIAAQMGCPVGTVRSRIFRARETIFKQIQEQFYLP